MRDVTKPAPLSAVAFLPHALAVYVATQGKLLAWDNRNPRSSDMKARLKQRIPAKTYATYERMEACHANGMEVRLEMTRLDLTNGDRASLSSSER